MCGIVGYTGEASATPILVEGLTRMEYRGYDSAGVAVEQDGGIQVITRKGKVAELAHTLGHFEMTGTCGIGHTRWATHGKPSEANAHPHTSCSGDIAVVHNGIIENFAELREELVGRGHVFKSETDTEVVAHLVEESYHRMLAEGTGDLRAAVAEAAARLVGAYGLAVMADAEPGTIIACRKDSPIVVGCGETGSYVASDIIAMIDATRDVVVLADGQMARLRHDGIEYYDEAGNPIKPDVTHVDWDLDVAEKGGYPDFMLKEIHEQPRVIRDTLAGRLVAGSLVIDELDMTPAELNLVDRVYIIACGTSYHAGLIAKNLIESWARIPCEVEVASEFRYRNPIITPTTLVVAVSQSGETADTLAAIRDARVKGAKVFGITNVVGTPGGPRIRRRHLHQGQQGDRRGLHEVAFWGRSSPSRFWRCCSAQAVGRLTGRARSSFCSASWPIPPSRSSASSPTAIRRWRRRPTPCVDATSALFIGRGMGAATSYEGALKLKEISYLHAEAYAGRRDEARPHRPYRRGIPRGGHRDEEPRVRQGGVEFAGVPGPRRHASSPWPPRATRKSPSTPTTSSTCRRCATRFSPITASVPLQLLCARRGRQARVRRRPASQSREIGDGRIAMSLFRRRTRPRGGAFAYPR